MSFAQDGSALAVAIAGDPGRLVGPAFPTLALIQPLLFDSLVGRDERNQPFPQLAEVVPTAENGLAQVEGLAADRRLVVTMPLRPGVSWSDGTPFSATDVAYTFELMKNPASGLGNPTVGRMRHVEVLDELTVRFVYHSSTELAQLDPGGFLPPAAEPVVDPHFSYGLGPDAYLLPAHRLRAALGDDPRRTAAAGWEVRSGLARDPVGTGPYTLERWEPGRGLSLRARAGSLPQRLASTGVQRVTFAPHGSAEAAIAALEAGAVQVVGSDLLQPSLAARLDRLPGVQWSYAAGPVWEHLTFSVEHPILADVDVRRALAYGTNRRELVGELLAGTVEPMLSPIPDWSWAAAANVSRFDFDPNLAADLLQSKGWARGADGVRTRDGRRLSLRLWTTSSSLRARAVALLRVQLQRIGVEIEAQFVPERIFFHPRAVSPQSLASRRFDLALFSSQASPDPGDDAWHQLHSGSIPGPDNGYVGANYSGFRHARNDQLVEQGLTSIDMPFRHVVYTQLQQLWMAELPLLPLFQHPVVSAATLALGEFRPAARVGGEAWNAEQWRL